MIFNTNICFYRTASPIPKTDNASTSATNSSFVPLLASTKQEVQEHEEVEFLDDTANDTSVQFLSNKGGKHEDDGNDFEDSNQDLTGNFNYDLINCNNDFRSNLILKSVILGDETHDTDFDMTPGPSNLDDTTEQVPQGKISFCFQKCNRGIHI